MNVPPSPMPYSRPKRRPFFKRGWVRIALLLMIAGGAWYLFGHSSSKGPKGPAAVVIRTAAATQKPVPLTINAVGTVVAYETVAIRSRLDSQVIAVNFKDGDEVKQGDVLFQLDDKALKAQAAQLQANINRDKAQLENASRQYDRAETLAVKGFATKANRDDARAARDAAAATVGADIAALNNVNVQIGYARVTAPISGRTGTINVTLGNTVKANDTQPLVVINQLKPIRVQASLPQSVFDAVRTAMQAGTVTVTASKQDDAAGSSAIAEGRLEYLDNAVDQATGTFVTRAGFTNEDEQLWPGMFVTMTMTLGEDQHALTVPEVAIQHGQNGDYVYAIVGEKALRRDVKIARMQDGLAVVSSGLAEGDVVATDGLLGLKDGVTVTIQKDAPPKGEEPPAAEPAK